MSLKNRLQRLEGAGGQAEPIIFRTVYLDRNDNVEKVTAFALVGPSINTLETSEIEDRIAKLEAK